MILPVAGHAPYYQAPGVAIYKGDCREVMSGIAGGSASLVWSDPPYNLSDEENQGMAREARPHSPIAGDKGEWDRMDPEMFEGLITGYLDQSWRVLRPGGTIIVCCSHHEEDNFKRWLGERFEIMNRIIWWKPNPSPLFVKNRLVWSHEYLFVARKPGRKNTVNWDLYPYTEMHDVWKGPLCQGRERLKEPYIDEEGKQRWRSIHPTQKPLWLAEKAIRIYSNPDDLVVDPFAGVLTGPDAAQRHGRRVIGIELDLENKYLPAGIPRLKG